MIKGKVVIKPTDSTNFHNRAVRFNKYVKSLGVDGNQAFEAFDNMLDVLLHMDFFGEEGEHDPRHKK